MIAPAKAGFVHASDRQTDRKTDKQTDGRLCYDNIRFLLVRKFHQKAVIHVNVGLL